jgi:hypothetical protein
MHSSCSLVDGPGTPEEKQSPPEKRGENQILPPLLSIDLSRRKDRAVIPACLREW